MDSRLGRALPAEQAAEFATWYKASKTHLAELARVLGASAEASRGTSDEAITFSGPNALAELAHKAGYREGLKDAIRLLTPRT